MQRDEHQSFLTRATRALQNRATGAGPAVAASYTLIGSICLLGGLGYAVDARYGTTPAFLVGGLLLGVAAGLYQLAKTLWQK